MGIYDMKKRPAQARSSPQKRRPQGERGQYDGMMQMASMMGNSEMEEYLRQEQAPRSNALATESGGSELPPSLRERMEARLGVPLDDVRVHYNSDKPVPFMARAFAKGSEIHIAPGQEDTLEHELGHVAQQKAGLVRATGSINGEAVNEDEGLEREADSGSNAAMNDAGRLADSASETAGVVQMCGLFGCCTNVDEPVISRPLGRGTGPCATDAIAALGLSAWPDSSNFQDVDFPATLANFNTLPANVLVAFYRPGETTAFHIMYTEHIGKEKYICGTNNDITFLEQIGINLANMNGILCCEIPNIPVNNSVTVKYMSRAEYDKKRSAAL